MEYTIPIIAITVIIIVLYVRWMISLQKCLRSLVGIEFAQWRKQNNVTSGDAFEKIKESTDELPLILRKKLGL